MKNDAFLSYAHEDRDWALRLHRDLTNQGLSVFLDEKLLRTGGTWEQDLTRELNESRHVVLLWSDYAGASEWVKAEANMFLGMIANVPADANRKLMQVCLKGRWDRLGSLQGLENLTREPTFNYAGGAAQVDAGLWDGTVGKLLDDMGVSADAPAVWQVILAATRAEMEAVDIDDQPDAAPSLADLLRQLGMTRDDLLARYGDRREDCRPFAGDRNVLALLAEIRNNHLELGGKPFRWRPVGASFWSGDANKVAQFAYLFRTEPTVVAVDAFSLYVNSVRGKFRRIGTRCLENPCAALMVLPPFGIAQRECLRRTIGELMQEVYTQVFCLDFAQTALPQANCDLLTPDDYEMRRLVAATLLQSRGKHWATQAGAGR